MVIFDFETENLQDADLSPEEARAVAGVAEWRWITVEMSNGESFEMRLKRIDGTWNVNLAIQTVSGVDYEEQLLWLHGCIMPDGVLSAVRDGDTIVQS